MMLHPRIPVWPPASRFFLRCFNPTLRVGYQFIVQPVAALVAGGRINDAGNMAACGQDKARIPADEVLCQVSRFPRHNVVLAGCEQINRSRYLRQVNRYPALPRLARILDVVFEIGIARVPTVHRTCLLYTSPSPRDGLLSRMPSSA